MKPKIIYQTIFMAVLALLIISCTNTENKEDESTGERTDTVAANEPAMHEMTADHLMVMPADIQWAPSSGGLPAGAQVAVIEGDPAKQGLFIMRAKFPAGYTVRPHFHGANEHVTVLEGTLGMGMGDTFDETKATEVPAGGMAIMKAGTHHFAVAKTDCTIQLHGMGPWTITYLNPDDDPRNIKP